MTVGEAWALTAAGVLVYAAAAWAIAPLLLALAPVPLAVFVAYPYLKRVTAWCHLGVGLGLATAPLGGWLAARASAGEGGGAALGASGAAFTDPGPALLLAAFTLLWVAGFDVIYATLDEAFDREAGVRSLPARYGRSAAIRIARVMHAAAWASLAALTLWRLPGLPALAGLALVGALLVWEQARVDDMDLAFFRVNVGVGFAALATVAAGVAGG
jgi:4-hydroxybenzoate polyprenyltransferase